MGMGWIDARWDVASILASSFSDFYLPSWPRVSWLWLNDFYVKHFSYHGERPLGNPLLEYFLLNPVMF